jgi:hypothetical protein
VHDVAWPHPCPLPPIVIGPLSAPLLPPELPLEPLDPELPELLELLAEPPLEPELLEPAPELLPLRDPPLLLVPPLLLPRPLLLPLLPASTGLFVTGVVVPLEDPLVSAGGSVLISGTGFDEVQPEIETATSAAVPKLTEWRFFISASRPVGLLEDGA